MKRTCYHWPCGKEAKWVHLVRTNSAFMGTGTLHLFTCKKHKHKNIGRYDLLVTVKEYEKMKKDGRLDALPTAKPYD